MTIKNTQIYMFIAWKARKQFYKTIKSSIRRLVASKKMFNIRLLVFKYLYYPIIRDFVSVI